MSCSPYHKQMTTISAPIHVYVDVYLYIYYKLFKFEAIHKLNIYFYLKSKLIIIIFYDCPYY
jgi:hypothetical protein